MSSEKINLKEKLSKFSDHWSPKVIAEMNDFQFKLVKIKGDFVWHNHGDTDEFFLVIEGEMKIEFKDETVILKEGQIFVVPKGVEHKPYAEEECKIMIVEPRGVINTGDAESNLKASNDVWIQSMAKVIKIGGEEESEVVEKETEVVEAKDPIPDEEPDDVGEIPLEPLEVEDYEVWATPPPAMKLRRTGLL